MRQNLRKDFKTDKDPVCLWNNLKKPLQQTENDLPIKTKSPPDIKGDDGRN